MKVIKPLLQLTFCGAILFSCENKDANKESKVDSLPAKDSTAQTGPRTDNEVFTYKVDTTASVIKWKGKKVMGDHKGEIKLGASEIKAGPSELAHGTIVINMSSITDTDLSDKKKNADLVGHLKSADFFDTEKYPTATYRITNMSPGEKADENIVSGQLMLKGVSENLSFPVKIKMEGNQLKVTGKAVMDRTKWGVKYKSGKSLGDQMIYDEIELDLDIVANK
ncbi:MAG: YceI family protein [Cytophagaceae bacterium]